MKKFYRTSLVVVIIGLITAIIGGINHGVKPVIDNGKTFTYTAINDRLQTTTLTNRTDFNIVEMNLDQANVQITQGKQNKIVFKSNNPYALRAHVAGRKLIVGEPPLKGIVWKKINNNVQVIIPKKLKLRALVVGSASGNAEINNYSGDFVSMITANGRLVANQLTTNSANLAATQRGKIDIDRSKITNSDIDINSGNLSIANSIINTNARTVGGNATITNTELLGNNSIEMKKGGDIVIKNASKLSYKLISNSEGIYYHNLKPRNHFAKRVAGKNSLYVKNLDGTIAIK